MMRDVRLARKLATQEIHRVGELGEHHRLR